MNASGSRVLLRLAAWAVAADTAAAFPGMTACRVRPAG